MKKSARCSGSNKSDLNRVKALAKEAKSISKELQAKTAERSRLNSEIRDGEMKFRQVTDEIKQHGGNPVTLGVKAKRETLEQVLRSVMKHGKPMTPEQIVSAVDSAGYDVTHNSYIRSTIGARMRHMSDIKRVGRGLWSLETSKGGRRGRRAKAVA